MLNHKGTINIETERLLLRKFTEKDSFDMYRNWATDSEVTQYLSWQPHSNLETTKQVINSWIDNYKSNECYQWAIEMKESKNVIGCISLLNIDNQNENGEIGYCISKAHWNKGIVTEAFLNIIDFAFNQVGFERITGRHHIGNIASGKVMEKCGLKYEGILRKIIKNNNGNLVDCKYYSILKDEYQK